MVAHRHRAGRLPSDRDFRWVAAEFGDIVADPPQCGLLVGQSVVADVAVRAQRRMGQEPQGAQPVVDGDDDDVALGRHPTGVVDVGAAVEEAAAVNPHHHRLLARPAGAVRGPDVEVQAVLTGGPAVVGIVAWCPGYSAGRDWWHRAPRATAPRVAAAASAAGQPVRRHTEFRRTPGTRGRRHRAPHPRRSAPPRARLVRLGPAGVRLVGARATSGEHTRPSSRPNARRSRRPLDRYRTRSEPTRTPAQA